MARFGEKNVLLRLAVAPVGHVLEQDQDAGAVIVGVNEAPRTDQHCAGTDGREIGFYLVSDNGGRTGDDLANKAPEFGYAH